LAQRSNNTLVATIPKSESEELRVELAHYKGGKYAAMRIFAKGELGGPMLPTRNGLTVSLQALPQLLAALRAVETEASQEDDQGEFGLQLNFYRQSGG